MGYGKEIAIALVGGSLLVTAAAGLGGYEAKVTGEGIVGNFDATQQFEQRYV